MSNNNEKENADISNNKETSEDNIDIISKLLNNEQDFISLIKKILKSEFEELFPKILNLPKIDFLNQLTSNVSFILSEQFTPKIFDNDKCMSLLTGVCRSFDEVYNRYMEELSEGWDKYNFEKMNHIQNPLNENKGIGEYARLLAPNFAKEADRLIITDSADIYFKKDLLELYNYPLEGKFVKGIIDPFTPCFPDFTFFKVSFNTDSVFFVNFLNNCRNIPDNKTPDISNLFLP